jgi:hypothetical protein
MIRLGLQLVLRSGREALVRFLAMVVAVAIGAFVLLGLFAEFHGFEATARTPSWSSTNAAPHPGEGRSHELLWNYSETIFRGRAIQQLAVAPLGPDAPHIPGLAALPAAGHYDASLALAHLLATTPADQLADRFPGTLTGTVGDQALTGPNELAIVVGYRPAVLAKAPGTITVDQVSAAAQISGTTNIYRLAFGVGAIALVFPLLILVSTATRLSAARREQRYAAMRLVGATTAQVGVLATVEAALSALAGTLLGCLAFVLLRPAIADISLSGDRFFPHAVTATAPAYLALLLVIPAAATITSLIALRRVRTSPLGVARRATPPPPKVLSVLPLVFGIGLFLAVLLPAHPPKGGQPNATAGPSFNLPLALLGFLFIMIGLISGGPWLTKQTARLLARHSSGPSGLLAGRRLEDSPATAFRAVSGLVLAVFVATTIGVVAATVNTAQSRTPADTQLAGVLRMNLGPGSTGPPPPAGKSNPNAATTANPPDGLSARQSASLLHQLAAFRGTTVVPIYNLQGGDGVVSCASLATVPSLGTCPFGAHQVGLSPQGLVTDNPLYLNKILPLVSSHSPREHVPLQRLQLETLLVKTPNPSMLERVRTFLATDTDLAATGLVPETFGEAAKIRSQDISNVEHVVLAAALLTLIVASCSLAVTVGGGLLERRRPFTLLRLSGTSLATLRRVVLMESTLPLLAGAVIAAGIGLGVARPFTHAVLPTTVHTTSPSPGFYLVLAAGLLVALVTATAALPLLARITNPDQARFE